MWKIIVLIQSNSNIIIQRFVIKTIKTLEKEKRICRKMLSFNEQDPNHTNENT